MLVLIWHIFMFWTCDFRWPSPPSIRSCQWMPERWTDRLDHFFTKVGRHHLAGTYKYRMQQYSFCWKSSLIPGTCRMLWYFGPGFSHPLRLGFRHRSWEGAPWAPKRPSVRHGWRQVHIATAPKQRKDGEEKGPFRAVCGVMLMRISCMPANIIKAYNYHSINLNYLLYSYW